MVAENATTELGELCQSGWTVLLSLYVCCCVYEMDRIKRETNRERKCAENYNK